jgi:hypothetical protein
MLKRFPAAVVLAAVMLVVLAGCPTAAGTGGVTVSGTLSGDYINFFGDPVITVSQAGSSFPITVITVVAGNNVSGPYSIPNVSPGTYAISVTFTSSMYTFYAIPNYSIDGGTPINIGVSPPVGVVSGQYYDYNLAVPSITISKDTKIDIYLGNNG